jgi:hypothetical protein
MGRYIDEILQPGEKVLYSTNLHWIFYWRAIAAWILALVLLVLSRTTTTEGLILLCLSASAVVALAALYWTVTARFHRWTTETDVTNLRLLNYGDVTILGVGEGKETIATIASPLAFRNFITAR